MPIFSFQTSAQGLSFNELGLPASIDNPYSGERVSTVRLPPFSLITMMMAATICALNIFTFRLHMREQLNGRFLRSLLRRQNARVCAAVFFSRSRARVTFNQQFWRFLDSKYPRLLQQQKH